MYNLFPHSNTNSICILSLNFLLTLIVIATINDITSLFSYRVDVVAVDLLGHGDSPAPNQSNLYTADEVMCLLLHQYDIIDIYSINIVYWHHLTE